LLDVQNVDGAYAVARDVRDNLMAAFPNAKIMEDAEGSDEGPPPGVTEERDIKAWCVSRLIGWANLGVVQRANLATAIADGSLYVQVNSSDPTQVDIALPIKIVQPWAKAGVAVQRRPG
jgi:phage tail sheath gpL-like